MFRFLQRYREPLVVGALLLLPLASYLSTGHRGREPNLIDRLVLGLSSPLQGALTWVVSGITETVDGYLALRGSHEEAGRCRGALAESTAEVNALREAQAENERLKRVLGYVEVTGEQEILARVVGLNPTAQFQSLRLNRGENEGVHAGMPVVTAVLGRDGTPQGAVVGQVLRAVAGSADVLLLTDPSSRIGVVTQRTRVRGTAAGAGDGKRLALEYVLREDDVQDGDAVVTAGTDGVYPRGLLVGTVNTVKRPVIGMFLSGVVAPAVELRRLEEVLVVPGGAAPLPVSAGKGRAP